MAIILNKDEKNPVGYAAQATQPAGSVISVADSGGMIGGVGGGAAPTANPGKSLANFPDVNAYLDANRDTAKDQAKKAVNTLVGKTESTLGDDLSKFKSSIDSVAITQLPTNDLNAVMYNPASIANDPAKTAAFQKTYNASYAGPTGYTPSSDALQKYNGVVGAKTVNDILPMIYDDKQYVTPGMKALDGLVIGGIPDAFNSITNSDYVTQGNSNQPFIGVRPPAPKPVVTTKPFGALQQYFDNVASEGNKYAGDAKTNSENNVQYLKNAVKNESDDLSKNYSSLTNIWGNGSRQANTPYNLNNQWQYDNVLKPRATALETLTNNPNLFSWV